MKFNPEDHIDEYDEIDLLLFNYFKKEENVPKGIDKIIKTALFKKNKYLKYKKNK